MEYQAEKTAGFLTEKKKMEALGRLSCKVAHDLNNILGAIEGYATLAMNAARPEDPLRQDMAEIRKAVAKAAAFNRQLLVFGGRYALHRGPCSVNSILEHLVETSASSGNLKLELSLQQGIPEIMGDTEQLEQALLNLLLNARDAMAGGGTVVINSSLLRLEGAAVNSPDPEEAGSEFIRISIRDNGSGMSKEALEHLFEPAFFPGGKNHGSGLGGLSHVYGVIKRHNGWVEAESAPGRGSEFSVYLPVSGSRHLKKI